MGKKHSSHSVESFTREFLDVIICGFAAVLVLAIIFSVTVPPAIPAVPPNLRYQLFQFTVDDRTDPSAGGKQYALMPKIAFEDKAGYHEIPVVYEPGSLKWQAAAQAVPPGMEITLVGFTDDPSRGATQTVVGEQSFTGPRQIWSVLFADLPEKTICHAQVVFRDQSTGLHIPALPLRCAMLPDGGNEQKCVVPLGQLSAFQN